ncbi:phosphatase PAP2 family protein [Streptomyces otsuchiensis]|uniref:phosphatase PAP2 family protein n=1 Tax=Streptomyces otsuchiensis TaxID=2681388 RepID=UPI001582A981|nr:phosphatase PAP2 family protein [Streptomyces otsuchiensis]
MSTSPADPPPPTGTQAPPPDPGAPPGAVAERRVARWVTEACSPGVLLMIVVCAVGWHATGSVAGLGWALLTLVFCCVLPYGFVLWGVGRGRWSDWHITRREQRLLPLAVGMAGVSVAVLLLAVIPGAPRDLVALVLAMLAGGASTVAVTLWWKISVHTAVAAGATAVLIVTYGGPLTPLTALLPVLTGWSRVALRDHTVAQVVAGGAQGALFGSLVYALLR